MWIVVIPPDKVGGPMRVATKNASGEIFASDTEHPVQLQLRADAELIARTFRQAFVIEERDGEWILPKL